MESPGGPGRRARRPAPAAGTAAVLARGLVHLEVAFVRMLYVLHCVEQGCPAYTGKTDYPAGDCSGAR